jgi:predicted O-methyltransferase YrrM
MTRSKALVQFAGLIFKDFGNVLKALLKYTEEADKRIYVQNKLGFKNGLPFVDIKDLVKSLDEKIDNYTFLSGTSYPNDILFLKAICRNYSECEYFEIGSWRGESISNVAQVAKHCTSLSLSKQEIVELFGNKTMASVLKLFSEGVPNITHIEHNSMTFDFSSLNKKFDVIFVDGDHRYDAVKSDTANAFKLLKDENSVIVFHDCGVDSEDNRYEVIAGVLDGTPVDKRKNIYRVSNTLCAIYTSKDIKPMAKSNPQTPDKIFSIDIKAQPYKMK